MMLLTPRIAGAVVLETFTPVVGTDRQATFISLVNPLNYVLTIRRPIVDFRETTFLIVCQPWWYNPCRVRLLLVVRMSRENQADQATTGIQLRLPQT